MTDLLVKLFVNGWQDAANPVVRTRYGQFAGIVGIVCNVALSLAKGAIGLVAGSVSIVADAVKQPLGRREQHRELARVQISEQARRPGPPLTGTAASSTSPASSSPSSWRRWASSLCKAPSTRS